MTLTKQEIDLLDKLERRYKVNLRKATPEEVTSLLSSDEFQLDFSGEDDQVNNKFTEVINLLGKVIEEKATRDVVNASAIVYKLVLSRNRIVNYYDSFENSVYTRDEFLNLIQAEIDSDDPIISLNAALVNLENLLNLTISREKLVENLKKISSFSEDILTNQATYFGKCDLIDLVCRFLNTYFNNIGLDICKENPEIWEWVKREITALQKVEDEDFNRPSEFDLPEDTQLPEELGLIDITKLRKDGDENG